MNRLVTGQKQLQLLDLTITTGRSDVVHGPARRYTLMLRRLLIPALAALLVTTPALAQRGDGFPSSQWDRRGDRGEEREREVSLNSVQRQLQGRYGGQMLDAQKLGDRYIISWITKDGRRLTIEVDATNGRVLSTR